MKVETPVSTDPGGESSNPVKVEIPISTDPGCDPSKLGCDPSKPGIVNEKPLQRPLQPPLSLARVADPSVPVADKYLQNPVPSPLSIARVADSLDPADHTLPVSTCGLSPRPPASLQLELTNPLTS